MKLGFGFQTKKIRLVEDFGCPNSLSIKLKVLKESRVKRFKSFPQCCQQTARVWKNILYISSNTCTIVTRFVPSMSIRFIFFSTISLQNTWPIRKSISMATALVSPETTELTAPLLELIERIFVVLDTKMHGCVQAFPETSLKYS